MSYCLTTSPAARTLTWLLVLSLVLPLWNPIPVQAASCSATVSPTTVGSNQGTILTFTITNSGSADVVWVKITRPNSTFTLNGGSSSGWSRSLDTADITYTGGSLSPSNSHPFALNIQTSPSATSGAWSVQVSESSDGSSSTTCSGDTTVTISGDTTSPVISNIAASNVSATGATITWTTDEPASSLARYGLTTSYGSTQSSPSLKTAHSLTLSGLSPSTTYHYQVESADGSTNTTTSEDKIFTTAASGSSAPTLTNITVQNITTSGATVTWTTNQPASSRVDYGLTSSYGTNSADATLKTSHSLNLSNLSSDTTYHYRIQSTNSDNQTATSADNTFTTTASATGDDDDDSSTGSSGGSSSNSSSNSNSTSSSSPKKIASPTPSPSGALPTTLSPEQFPLPAPDRESPVVSVTTALLDPFSTPPPIEGEVTDNRSVQSISYSLDGGRNWLPVTASTGPSTRRLYSITLPALEDNNYAVQVRAFDAAGNVGVSAIYPLVIDHIPPVVGPSLYTVGAQDIVVAGSDASTIIVGLDQRLTLSAVGGATTIDIVAQPQDSPGAQEHIFSLAKRPDTGLWTGVISLAASGHYQLVARALDGAGNRTERLLRQVQAIPGGVVMNGEQAVSGATVTIYRLDTLSHRFISWDARPFNQENPQITDDQGHFKALLPPGTYHLKVEHDDLRTTQTSIFHIDHNTVIHPLIVMEDQEYISFGRFRLPLPPSIFPKTTPLTVTPLPPAPPSRVVGQKLPISAPPLELDAATTLLVLLTDWHPQASTHLRQLNDLNALYPGRIKPIFIQTSAARLAALGYRGNYTLPLVSDPLGLFAADLGIDTAPAYLLVSHDGTILHESLGIKSTDDLKNLLNNQYQ